MANNRTAAGEIMKILGQRDQRKNVAQVTKRERGGATTWTDLSNHHTKHQTGGDDVISVDDDMIGNRTLTDANAPTSSTGKLAILLGWLANMIKSITGKSSWRTTPSATLEDVATHIANNSIHVHNRVRAATTASITLSGTQTIDDVVLIANDRVLVKDQGTGSENGVYVVASGAWSRATDFDAQADIVSGAEFYVMDGTTNKKRAYNLTSIEPITIGVSTLTFEQISGGTTPGGGSAWYDAAGVPDVGTGVNGDYYLNTTNGDVYKKVTGSWVLSGNIKGVKGDKGDTGAAGAIGDYAENSGSHSGLNFAYYGGKVRSNNVVYTTAAGSIALTDNATNYIEVDPGSGTVYKTTTGFTAARTPMFTAVTSGGSIITVTDKRCFFNAGGTGAAWFSMNTATPLTASVTTGIVFSSIPK